MEWWNSGMMGLKDEEQIDRKNRFCTQYSIMSANASLRAQYSIIPIGERSELNSIKSFAAKAKRNFLYD